MFVGSSSQASELIAGLSLGLDSRVTVRPWNKVSWPLTSDTLDGIDEHLQEADFAVFILADDDVAIIRGKEAKVPRDNVILELGMSLGSLGRERTFILTPSGTEKDVHKPSDLLGITVVQYTIQDTVEDTMSTPSERIWKEVQKRGRRDRLRLTGALTRGDTEHVETIVDGALHVNESRNEYEHRLRRAMESDQCVPAKFQFALPDGGHYWLAMCRGNKYKYFKRARAHLQRNAPRIATKVNDALGSTSVDVVSLGCGDGTKDDILLRALASKLAADEYLYYYPIDISDILLVEAIRQIAKNGLKKHRFRCKPILGDFTNLASLTGVVAYRKNRNLFSVLGNTIGSFDESSIFASIEGALEPGDLVLIEANTGDPKDSLPVLKEDAAGQWDWSTLDALGIAREECEMSQEESDDVSMVDGTRTLVTSALHQNGSKAKKYMLSAMHHYDYEQLKDYVQDTLRVSVIDEIPGDGVCLLLGQREE
jgi:Predicted nucleotide-binding protein containing TIR-like domain/Histidine-specific methyltransferase, SAM-dependent